MTWYRVGPAGIPGSLKTDMDAVLNKKFGTSTTYAPNTWPDNVNLLGPLPEKTASGAIANITDGADAVPLKNWLVTLPASLDGYSAIGCNEGGANFIDLYTRASHNGIDYSINADGSLHRYGTASGNSFNNGNATNYSNCPFKLRAGTYTLSVSGSGDNSSFTSLGIYLASGASFTAQGITGNGTKTFTVSEDFGAWFYIKTNSGVTVNDDVYIWLSAGSTADAYAPYVAPTTYTASLGRTIYGGTADIVTGEGTETHTRYEITGTETGYYLAGTNNNGNRIDFAIFGAQTPLYSGGLSNYGENKACLNSGTWTIGAWCIYNSRLFVVVPNEYDTFAKALEYLVNEQTQFVYPLATSTAFTFTPITPTPETALGVNNFWADEGDSDVTYRADISLALQALGGGGRGLMGMIMQRPEEEQLTEEDPEEQPEETETNER